MKKIIRFGNTNAENMNNGTFFSNIIYYIINFFSIIFCSQIIDDIIQISITSIKLFLLKLAGGIIYILIKACNIITDKKIIH